MMKNKPKAIGQAPSPSLLPCPNSILMAGAYTRTPCTTWILFSICAQVCRTKSEQVFGRS